MTLLQWLAKHNPLAEHAEGARVRTRGGGCESLEPRVLLAANLVVGAVYFEEASGHDDHGDEITVSFAGGADGSQLVRMVIEGDKGQDGLGQGDIFFDTITTGQDETSPYGGSSGTFGAVPFQVVSADGFSYRVTQTTSQLDGSPRLEITFDGFEAGEKFVFRIDVDEQGFRTNRASALAEGAEFEDSILTAEFTAPHYEDIQVEARFLDDFTSEFQRLGGDSLPLPPDEYDPPVNPERTAGAIGRVLQRALPNTISGRVFHDRNLSGRQDAGDEEGLAGVTIELWKSTDGGYRPTGRTTTTNANGDYEFKDVELGDYRLVESQPSGYRSVGAVVGTVDGAPRGRVESPDVLTDITLLGGEDSVRNDFAEAKEVSLAGWVYHDRNDDGVRDSATEEGIGGVRISVQPVDAVDPTQGVVEVVTTADGAWSAAGLSPGEYRIVEVAQPSGYLDGTDAAGSLGGVAVNPGDEIIQVVAPSGAAGVNYNFGEVKSASLSGRVHVDTDGDCIFDPDEVPLAGVTIQLLDADGNVIVETKTNSSGEYEFTGLRPGRYSIYEVQPAGYFDGDEHVGTAGGRIVANDLIGEIDLEAGEVGVHYDFCELGPNSIAGQVFIDLDGDCYRDPSEQPAVGVRVDLLNDRGEVIDTRLTDANGRYQFDQLPQGNYSVRETQPEGLLQGGTLIGSAGGVIDAVNPDLVLDIDLVSGVTALGYDYCEIPPSSLSGSVYHDADVDGVRDAGETGIPEVDVALIDSTGAVVETQKTDADGRYRFKTLAPDKYTIVETQPAGYLDGAEHVGSIGGRVSENDRITDIALAAGQSGVDYDFGELLPGSLSGIVHFVEDAEDCEGDEHGEPMPDVIVQLLNADGDLIDETITDAEGRYEFVDLPPGEYELREIQPEGYISVGQHVGTAGGRNAGEDLIDQIRLLSATVGEDYNFCETVVPETPPPQYVPPIFTPLPEPLPAITSDLGPLRIAPAPDVFPPPQMEPLAGRIRPIMTWHLSIVDAGRPRGELATETATSEQATAPNVQPARLVVWSTPAAGGKAFGVEGGVPLIGDFDGDGISDFSIYRNGEWFIDVNRNGVWDAEDLWARLGGQHDLPVVGDWNGDGKSDIGIFGFAQRGDKRAIDADPGLPDPLNPDERPGKNLPPEEEVASDARRQLRLTQRGQARSDVVDHVFAFGESVDVPVAGDWDGDGIATIGVFRDGLWLLDVDGDGRFTEADANHRFGVAGDTPVVGDWNGDGIDDFAVFHDGDWRIDADGDRAEGAGDKTFRLGGPDQTPIAGDWDGDGRDEPSVYQARGGFDSDAAPSAPDVADDAA